jgi:hypothetical protein
MQLFNLNSALISPTNCIIDHIKFVGVFCIHQNKEVPQTDYRVVLSPDLGISTSDFVNAWNDRPKSLGVAQAKAAETAAEDFPLIDPNLLEQGLVYLAGVGSAIAADVLKDLIKDLIERKLAKRKEAPDLVVIVVEQSDAPLIVVKEQER